MHVKQLTPTESYWLGIGSTKIGYVVSLTKAPGAPWEADREHWFRSPGIDWEKELGTKNDLTINPDIVCGTPELCPELEKQMAELEKTWSDDFQLYALGKLSPSDWSKTPPAVGTKLYAFAAAGTDPKRPRMVFDVNPSDPTKLDRIIWLSNDDSLSTWPNTLLTLAYEGDVLPSADYYYVANA